MKTKTNFIILFILAFSFTFGCKQDKKEIKIEYSIFEVDNGWGYDIKINNKTFIHQDVIPAVKNSKPFNSQEDAEKVAKLVIEKMKKKQMPPAVSKEEIEKLGINIDS